MERVKKSIKEFLKDADLYGWPVVVSFLSERYTHFSIREKSEPGEGSPTYSVIRLDDTIDGVKIKKTTFHRNGNVTIYTEFGVVKFINL